MRRAPTCAALVAAVAMLLVPLVLKAQVGPSDAVLDEIRSLAVAVDVAGDPGGAALSGPLQAVVRGELERAGILRDLAPARPGDCCILRVDVRLARGSARVADWGGIAAYSVRLELGQPDRLGRLDTWVRLWAGRTAGEVVDPRTLADQLRFAVRELTVEFVDRYLERFPIR